MSVHLYNVIHTNGSMSDEWNDEKPKHKQSDHINSRSKKEKKIKQETSKNKIHRVGKASQSLPILYTYQHQKWMMNQRCGG